MTTKTNVFHTPTTRRALIAGGVAVTSLSLLATRGLQPAAADAAVSTFKETKPMARITTKDGKNIYYKDWGTGPVITFSHGWPLSADAWDAQMLFLADRGYRVIAHDRRGHGRSDQTWTGNDMDTYADDLAALLDALDIKGATMVGHSTGGGEVARYIGRHGTKRVAKAALISAVPPYFAQSASNPEGAPISIFDGLRASLVADRAQFFKELAMPFFGYNRPGAKVSQGRSTRSGARG